LAISVLTKCNLSCKGCFAFGYKKDSRLEEQDLNRILDYFQGNGTRYFVILGGEPLLYDNLLHSLSKFKKSIFLLYTNATQLNPTHISTLQRVQNVIPVLSVDGCEQTTDDRRGVGVYNKVLQASDKLIKAKVPYGISTTICRSNFSELLQGSFIKSFESSYLTLHTYMQYMPVGCNSDVNEMLSPEMKALFSNAIREQRKNKDYLVANIPQDELDLWGECPSAGKGILHINAKGDIEPCMFTHYSSTNIYDYNFDFDAILKNQYLLSISNSHCQGCLAQDAGKQLQQLSTIAGAINTEENSEVYELATNK
jgi:MoaA/NifB/PqqE/SkfB family radical SAM enzyme